MELPEILRNVFLFLDTVDLISCAQVSKKWNDEAVPVLTKMVRHIRLQHEDLQRYCSMLEYYAHSTLTICVKNECPEGINVKVTLDQIQMIARRAKSIHLNLYFNDKPSVDYDNEEECYNFSFGDQILTKEDIVFVISSFRESLKSLRLLKSVKFSRFDISSAYTIKSGPILLPELNMLEFIEFWHFEVCSFLSLFQFPPNPQYPKLKQIIFKKTIFHYDCGTGMEKRNMMEGMALRDIRNYFQNQIPTALYQLEDIPRSAEP